MVRQGVIRDEKELVTLADGIDGEDGSKTVAREATKRAVSVVAMVSVA
jgi:hypothetical protein